MEILHEWKRNLITFCLRKVCERDTKTFSRLPNKAKASCAFIVILTFFLNTRRGTKKKKKRKKNRTRKIQTSLSEVDWGTKRKRKNR